MAKPEVRRQTQWVPLTKEQFRARFFARYYDPVFDAVRAERAEGGAAPSSGESGLEGMGGGDLPLGDPSESLPY